MSKEPWNKARIKYELEQKGMTMTGLAELKGIDPRNFRAVWSRCVRPAEAALSEYLGVPVEDLFPTRYPIRKSRILSSENEAAIASHMWTPPRSSLSFNHFEPGWVLAYVRPLDDRPNGRGP